MFTFARSWKMNERKDQGNIFLKSNNKCGVHFFSWIIKAIKLLFEIALWWFHFSAEGNGNPLQYSCLKNSMDRGIWRASVHRVAKSWTWLSRAAQFHFSITLRTFSKDSKAYMLSWVYYKPYTLVSVLWSRKKVCL